MTVSPNGSPAHYSVAGSPTGLIKTDPQTLWFSDTGGGHVSRMTTSGEVTEYPIPSGAVANEITAGPDGALYFTETQYDRIGRITPP